MSDEKTFGLKYIESIENLWISTLERAVGDKRMLGLPMRLFEVNLAAHRQMERLGSKWLSLWGLPTAAQMRETLTMLQRVEELLQAQKAADAARVAEAVRTVPAAGEPRP